MTPSTERTRQVLAYYDQTADTFVRTTGAADMSEQHERFLRYLAPGARILDAGCGSGRDSEAFLRRGYEVNAFDGSAELVKHAARRTGLPVQHLTFSEFEEPIGYDGIWACASLLHLDDAGFRDALDRLIRALRPAGVLFVSVKQGEGLRELPDGRVFNDFTVERLVALPEFEALRVQESWTNLSTVNNRDVWLSVVATKAPNPLNGFLAKKP